MRTIPLTAPRAATNGMTVDVEDYFQVSALSSTVGRDTWESFERRVEANTDRLLSIFAERQTLATFFVLGWIAERHPALIQRISDAGHEIASHGHSHRLVYEMTPVEFREDVRRTRDLLQEVTGRVICGYRAPSYSITKRCLWALEVLIEEGYQYDASIFPIYHDRYGIPSAPRHIHVIETPAGSLIEIPPSTCRFAGFNLPIAGGGYFRMLPYGLIRWGMRRVNRSEARPIVFYIHPWEVDPGQPRLPASWLNRVRHYRNLHRAEARLRLLLTEVSFAPLSQLVREHLEPALAQVSPALAGPAVVGEPL